jgi:tyrosine aminotransferase
MNSHSLAALVDLRWCSWRVGWLCVHDRDGRLEDVRRGLFALSQLVLGANSLALSALPAILAPTPGSSAARSLGAFHAATIDILQRNALSLSRRLESIPGLRVIFPQGAMYLMVGFEPTPDIPSDVEFSQLLLAEENVCVLPGTAFNIVNFVRIVFCAPESVLLEAADRIASFVTRHFPVLV